MLLQFIAMTLALSLSVPAPRRVEGVRPTIQQLPERLLGMYVLLGDDTWPNYTSTDVWVPQLHEYQLVGANVLYFTFINPTTNSVPPAFSALAQLIRKKAIDSGMRRPTLLFAIGGYDYSNNPNPWPFLESVEASKSMAEEVSTWPEKYGCDGIDIDLETGAGSQSDSGENLIAFIRHLNQLRPDMIITQPVFGYPQVKAETAVVNAAFQHEINKTITVNAVEIMVYSGASSLQYVKNYANGSQQWTGFPIHVDVPAEQIMCGVSGDISSQDLNKLVMATNVGTIGGFFVWYSSAIDTATNKTAINYGGGTMDASTSPNLKWAAALKQINATLSGVWRLF